MRLSGIEELAEPVEHLVTFGAARVPAQWRSWLLSTGVAVPYGNLTLMSPSPDFLAAALPAKNRVDLLRRAAMRDPTYRAHLDLTIAEVVWAIGEGGRWPRLEQLLFGELKDMTPRILQIFEWVLEVAGNKAALSSADRWLSTLRSVDGADGPAFAAWDEHLWGGKGRATEVFPQLLQLYAPLAGQPIYVSRAESNLDAASWSLLAGAVAAAQRGEALLVPEEESVLTRTLQGKGLPLRVVRAGGECLMVCAVQRIDLSPEADASQRLPEYGPIPGGLPEYVTLSRVTREVNPRVAFSFSSLAGGKAKCTAVLSAGADASEWPRETPEGLPDSLRLPGMKDLATIAHTGQLSSDKETTLLRIADHVVYGFLLQLLLLEAQDRELGDESLILAPPLTQRLPHLEPHTSVLYQPASEKRDGTSKKKGFLDLGILDEVLGRITQGFGVTTTAVVYRSDAYPGIWSHAFALMVSAALVVGRSDRWTMSPYLLERLYYGNLMREIVRGRKEFRGKLRGALRSLWEQVPHVDPKEVKAT